MQIPPVATLDGPRLFVPNPNLRPLIDDPALGLTDPINKNPIVFDNPFSPASSSVAVGSDIDRYVLDATFYPVNIAISADYSSSNSGSTDPETHSFGIEWFVIPEVAVSAACRETEFSNCQAFAVDAGSPAIPATFGVVGRSISTPDSGDYSLGITVRF